MIDAPTGGSEAERSDDGLSDASDLEDEGAGEFANVIKEMNNAAGNGGGEEVDEKEDADDAGIGAQGLVFRLRADEGQPSAADDGVVGAVAGVASPDGDAPPDGVAPAEARPRGRGPGRSRTLPVGVAGVIGPPPARTLPAAAVACNGSVAPALAVARNGSDGQMSGSSGTATAPGSDRGRVLHSDQPRNEEEEPHRQMMNVMLIAMMQNIARTNQQQERRMDISGNNEHQMMEIGGNNQQEPISGTNQQNDENNE